MSIITRAEYMSRQNEYMSRQKSNADFEEFFGQFVNSGTLQVAERALKRYPIELEIDAHFNDIPVTEWDRFAENMPYDRTNYELAYPDMKGRIWKSDLVCILKVAAIKVMEGRGYRKIWRNDPHGYTELRLRQRQGELRFDAITSEGDTWDSGREIRCVGRYEGNLAMWKVVDKDAAYTSTTEFAIVEEEAIRFEEPIGWTEHRY